MKVLFAVNSENISDSIIKKYLKDYREILSFNNVYYFDAIKKEIQKDKTYDRIVISEDLEPFPTSNYESIDKTIFEKIDEISDEAQDTEGNEIPIILICSDRRSKGSDFLAKLFSLGVYNALLRDDRNKEEVCKLINKPRTKKEAKLYYKVESENANYKAENENDVSETEIQNILNHFKKLGSHTEKYSKSFEKISEQYTEQQLKIITNCLPIKVREVLSEDSEIYQKLMDISGKTVKGIKSDISKTLENQKRTGIKIDVIENHQSKFDNSKPVIIPGKKLNTASEVSADEKPIKKKSSHKIQENEISDKIKSHKAKKNKEIAKSDEHTEKNSITEKKKKEKKSDNALLEAALEEENDLMFDDIDDMPKDNEKKSNVKKDEELIESDEKIKYSMSNLSGLMTKDKKIVTFVGSHKNGVSFLVNNLAEIFATLGINTAILDMTKNKNSYYIYTKNEETLRRVAASSIEKLQNGIAEGIKVKNNITVYTGIPTDEKEYPNVEAILSTLVQKHSLVLIDCDFETKAAYFANCQETYLVQSMDILTIQELTAFLRDLKVQNVLETEKIKIVINKELKVKGLTNTAIIGGMSSYNDPAMLYMTELFNKDVVRYCSIPFEENVYSKYLEAILNNKVSLNGYSKNFMGKLKVLADMVYPLTSKQTYGKNFSSSGLSNGMKNTLSKMKENYK